MVAQSASKLAVNESTSASALNISGARFVCWRASQSRVWERACPSWSVSSLMYMPVTVTLSLGVHLRTARPPLCW